MKGFFRTVAKKQEFNYSVPMNTILFFIFSFMAFSQDFVLDKKKGHAIPSYIGQVKLLKGKAYKKNSKGTAPVELGEKFKKDDVLLTDKGSFARIQIVDDTVISVGPKSEFKFDDIDFKDKTDRKLTFSLIKGQVTGEVKNKAKPQDIKFQTKYTAMGVRGTYFLMNHQTNGPLNIAEYALLKGEIDVNDEKKQTVKLNEGDKVVLIHDSTNNISKNDKLILAPEEIKRLKAEGINEENQFKPFLPYFSVSEFGSDSPLTSLFRPVKQTSEEKKGSTVKREEPKAKFEETLKELNKKLRENQKKR
jgi:effector-binding domain-containing protein